MNAKIRNTKCTTYFESCKIWLSPQQCDTWGKNFTSRKTLCKDHIEQDENQRDAKHLEYLFKELAQNTFHVRVNAIIRPWNDMYTSRNNNKINVCITREFLKVK